MFKGVYVGIGTFSLVVGLIGIVVPLLPTTPFLLLSAACYAKGSERLYHWFINIKWIGKHIHNYYEGKGISIHGKIFSILFLWTTIIISMSFLWSNLLVLWILFVVAISVTFHILWLKTMKEGLYSLNKYPVSLVFWYCQTVLHTKTKEHAMSLRNHEENPDKIGINCEPWTVNLGSYVHL